MTDSTVIKLVVARYLHTWRCVKVTRPSVTLGSVHIVADGVQTEFPVPKHVVDAVQSTGSHVVILRFVFGDGIFIINLHAVYWDRIKMSSFMSSKYKTMDM